MINISIINEDSISINAEDENDIILIEKFTQLFHLSKVDNKYSVYVGSYDNLWRCLVKLSFLNSKIV